MRLLSQPLHVFLELSVLAPCRLRLRSERRLVQTRLLLLPLKPTDPVAQCPHQQLALLLLLSEPQQLLIPFGKSVTDVFVVLDRLVQLLGDLLVKRFEAAFFVHGLHQAGLHCFDRLELVLGNEGGQIVSLPPQLHESGLFQLELLLAFLKLLVYLGQRV